ncbi:MAG: hypothetical protein OXU19_02390 [bacterium]|nr:hypothetical protein [bacterium]
MQHCVGFSVADLADGARVKTRRDVGYGHVAKSISTYAIWQSQVCSSQNGLSWEQALLGLLMSRDQLLGTNLLLDVRIIR